MEDSLQQFNKRYCLFLAAIAFMCVSLITMVHSQDQVNFLDKLLQYNSMDLKRCMYENKCVMLIDNQGHLQVVLLDCVDERDCSNYVDIAPGWVEDKFMNRIELSINLINYPYRYRIPDTGLIILSDGFYILSDTGLIPYSTGL